MLEFHGLSHITQAKQSVLVSMKSIKISCLHMSQVLSTDHVFVRVSLKFHGLNSTAKCTVAEVLNATRSIWFIDGAYGER